jgi:hypothetical protein
MTELAFLLIRQSHGRGANPDACRYAKDAVLAETRQASQRAITTIRQPGR